MENANNILFRCHQLGNILTGGRSKDVEMGDTAKTECLKAYLLAKYGRRKTLDNKYVKKGKECEEDSITLLAKQTRRMYRKNTERASNEFITGEWDLSEGVNSIQVVTDIKTSWELETFWAAKLSPLPKGYDKQVQGYMALTGAKKAQVAFCLVNAAASLIDDEKRKLAYSLGCFGVDVEPQEYIDGCIEIERNMIFDMGLFKKYYPWYSFHTTEWTWDIPEEERIHIFTIERDEKAITEIYERVKLCREHINNTFLSKSVVSLAA